MGSEHGLGFQFLWFLAARPWSGHFISVVLFLLLLNTGVLFLSLQVEGLHRLGRGELNEG